LIYSFSSLTINRIISLLAHELVYFFEAFELPLDFNSLLLAPRRLEEDAELLSAITSQVPLALY